MKDRPVDYVVELASPNDAQAIERCAAAVGQADYVPGWYALSSNDAIALVVKRRGMVVGFVSLTDSWGQEYRDAGYESYYLQHLVRTHLCPVSAEDMLRELIQLMPEPFVLKASCFRGSVPLAINGVKGVVSTVFRFEDDDNDVRPVMNFHILVNVENPPKEFQPDEDTQILMDLWLEDKRLGCHYTHYC